MDIDHPQRPGSPITQAGGVAPAIEVVGLNKRFGGVQALREVSIAVQPGEVLGLAGQNGAGKSTFVNVLSGIVSPDGGTVRLHGDLAPLGDPRGMADAGVAVVSQEQALVPNMRVWENVYLGVEDVGSAAGFIRARAMQRKCAELLSELGIEHVLADAVVSDLPFSARQLVEITRAIHRAQQRRQPIVLLDEPTSGLSQKEVDVLFALVRRAAGSTTFIFVSHVLRDMLGLCDRVVVMANGTVVADRPIADVNESTLHELMVGRSRRDDYYAVGRQASQRPGDAIIELRGAAVDEAFVDVDLAVAAGEVIGLAGIVGSGVSEVAACLAGALTPSLGAITVSGVAQRQWSVRRALRAGVHYVPPERRRDALFGSSTVADNIAVAYFDRVVRRWSRLVDTRVLGELVRILIGRVQLRPPEPRRMVGELSGGNQQKVVFARLIGHKCHVAVLDNPTRGVDVATREEIYEMVRDLASEGAGVVVTSESLEELIGLSDRLVVMRGGRVTATFACPPGGKPSELNVLAAL